MDYRFNQFEKGGNVGPVGYNDIKDVVYSDYELERIKVNRKRIVSGTPAEMKLKLKRLAEDYKVDEIVCATITEDFNDRLESYRLLAEQFELHSFMDHTSALIGQKN